MSGGRPLDAERLTELVLYVGTRPGGLRGGRVALAAVLAFSDFDAYRLLGQSITGARYLAAREPGQLRPPRGLLRAALHGWRWGRVGHAVQRGRLERRDAEWIARQWRGGVPL